MSLHMKNQYTYVVFHSLLEVAIKPGHVFPYIHFFGVGFHLFKK